MKAFVLQQIIRRYYLIYYRIGESSGWPLFWLAFSLGGLFGALIAGVLK